MVKRLSSFHERIWAPFDRRCLPGERRNDGAVATHNERQVIDVVVDQRGGLGTMFQHCGFSPTIQP
jgi:hypothetical protein